MFVDLHQPKSIFSMKTHTREHKVVVVGPRRVGKSALVVRFLTKRFISEYVENTDMQCIRVADVDGEPLKVHIQDTSDKAMRIGFLEHQLKWADAIMLVYSVNDIEGFRQLKNMADHIIQRNKINEEKDHSSLPPIVLVGNKGDLDFLRKVSQHEGFELAMKLQCDFFEASAREGWSKLITKKSSRLTSVDSDSIRVVAGTAGSIGVLGFPNRDVTREFVRSLTPTLNRRKSHVKTHYSDNERSPEITPVKRWGSFNSLNRFGDTLGSPKSPRENQKSPFLTSDEDSDEYKLNGISHLVRDQKPRSQSFISKLSPRLNRSFNRAHGLSSDPTDVKQSFRGDNNNNNSLRSKPAQKSIAFGLSTTFFTNGSLGDSLCQSANRNRLGSQSTNSSSSESAASKSDCGSQENLLLEDQNANSTLIQDKPPSRAIPGDTPIVVEPFTFEEHDFTTSEPFLNICRGKTSRSRVRSRSPTNKIVNSFKKIRTRSDQHPNNASNFQKQQQLLTNSSNLLAVPLIKY